MKIVRLDNFGRETVSDELVAENVPVEYAERIARALNAQGAMLSDEYFTVKPDNYVLYRFEP